MIIQSLEFNMAQVVQYPAIFLDKPLNDVSILHNTDESLLFEYDLFKKRLFYIL